MDFYRILKITSSASADEIRKAYKARAIETHPDKNGGTEDATEKFKQVLTAYECLMHPETRAAYDDAFAGSDAWASETHYQEPQSPQPTTSAEGNAHVDIEAEERKFRQKWCQHMMQAPVIEGKRHTLAALEGAIWELDEDLRDIAEDIMGQKEDWDARVPKFRLAKRCGNTLWFEEERYSCPVEYFGDILRKLHEARVARSKLWAEMQAMGEEVDSWTKKELQRLSELGQLEEKKRAFRAEELKKREEEEKRREAAARWQRCQEEAEHERKRREAELEKLQRKRAEEQECRARTYHRGHGQTKYAYQPGPPYQQANSCAHNNFWDKRTAPSQRCEKCYRMFGR
ncbi:hypothetical protein TWF730_008961 [Orbilia blumenaviensis]|uniref:J domain-containing protein n=1 Tax=Orbilia blumenaviensis TaxID=1796055 RepID=A0AAV9V030_9PEZI